MLIPEEGLARVKKQKRLNTNRLMPSCRYMLALFKRAEKFSNFQLVNSSLTVLIILVLVESSKEKASVKKTYQE